MNDRTKETIINTIRWVAFLPVECLCLVIGYAVAVNLLSFIDKFYRTGYLFHTIFIFAFLAVCTICGARIILPKHKSLATIFAIILCVLFMMGLVWLMYRKYLELNMI